jgi:hypothetical protein
LDDEARFPLRVETGQVDAVMQVAESRRSHVHSGRPSRKERAFAGGSVNGRIRPEAVYQANFDKGRLYEEKRPIRLTLGQERKGRLEAPPSAHRSGQAQIA